MEVYGTGPLVIKDCRSLVTVKAEGSSSSKMLSVKLSGLPSLSILELGSVSYGFSGFFRCENDCCISNRFS